LGIHLTPFEKEKRMGRQNTEERQGERRWKEGVETVKSSGEKIKEGKKERIDRSK
jgi:hypothetical protein